MVDIGAKTDYDALDPDVELKRACCHGGPTRVTFSRKVGLNH